MEKIKIGIYIYLIADFFLTDVLQKCLLSGPLPNIQFLSKPLNLTLLKCFGCYGNLKFRLTYIW